MVWASASATVAAAVAGASERLPSAAMSVSFLDLSDKLWRTASRADPPRRAERSIDRLVSGINPTKGLERGVGNSRVAFPRLYKNI
jgi:hypothetical protein